MAFTESNMIDLGTMAPDFTLPDTVSGKDISFSDIKGENGTLVIFLCNHCPYVIHINEELVKLCNDYASKGIGSVGISSNDVENYPDDSPEKMKVHAETEKYPFPYLYDEDQSVAKAYDAACTPDFYLFDGAGKLYYRGRLDDSRPKSDTPLTGKDLRDAINNMLEDQEAPKLQYPSGGCNIKWKK